MGEQQNEQSEAPDKRDRLVGIMRRMIAVFAGQDCTLCDDAQWWIDNGFSEAERRAFCASIGCPIPPEAA